MRKAVSGMTAKAVLAWMLGLGIFWSSNARAQYSFSRGRFAMEFGGSVSVFYNHRILKEGESDKKKNRFSVRDAQLQVTGIYDRYIEYRFQVDVADLAFASTDPENPGIMDAWVQVRPHPTLGIKIGYDVLPYGRFSRVPFIQSAYWQRAEIARGDVFSRRDVGVTLSSSLMNRQLNIYGGVYSGLGEAILRGDNDASGALEYLARVDYSFPYRLRNRDIDETHLSVPVASVGINGRWNNRRLPPGKFFPAGSGGEYGFKVINGEKLAYGLDGALAWKGFMLTGEIHRVRHTPQNSNDPIFSGLPDSLTRGRVFTGGWVAQASYFIKKIRLALALRYDELNISDVSPGYLRTLSPALCWKMSPWGSQIRLQYWHIFSEDSYKPERFTDQFRIGWIQVFR